METVPPPRSIAHYGNWNSPISAEKVSEGAAFVLSMLIDGEETYLCELRPKNKGRYTIVRCDSKGASIDMTPADFNVRSTVHEYGGAPFAVSKGILYASNASDQALYVIAPGKDPKRLTEGQTQDPSTKKWTGVRFADLQIAPQGLIAIAERHVPAQQTENFLALINLSSGKVITLASGCDFYSSPALSPDGRKIAWLSWNLPEMPWTHNELWTADFDESASALKNIRKIAGDSPESILEPKWSAENILYFISDRDKGWWNLHRYQDESTENICPMEAEIGDPQWIFGKSSYAFLGDKIVMSFNQEGTYHLGVIESKSRVCHKIPRQSANIQQLRAGAGFIRFLESYADKEQALMQLNDTPATLNPLPEENNKAEQEADLPLTARNSSLAHRKIYPLVTLRAFPSLFEEEYISKPIHYAFPSHGRMAYGFFYPPHNKHYKAPLGERPPLIIMIHGGPTSQAKAEFNLSKQFWTSRGFALFDINYAGSTGYGRSYRLLLNKKWGVYDVEDCIEGAKWLAKQGLVDENRLFIRGGSAGGYTTLAAIASTQNFRGAASYYGVADITALAAETHKFESRYMEQLIGKYPEEKDLWIERSPIHSVDKITTPLIIFQGENDAVVPKNQSIQIYEALKNRNVRVELHLYPDEEHGFRQAANMIHALTHEAEFYQRLF